MEPQVKTTTASVFFGTVPSFSQPSSTLTNITPASFPKSPPLFASQPNAPFTFTSALTKPSGGFLRPPAPLTNIPVDNSKMFRLPVDSAQQPLSMFMSQEPSEKPLVPTVSSAFSFSNQPKELPEFNVPRMEQRENIFKSPTSNHLAVVPFGMLKNKFSSSNDTPKLFETQEYKLPDVQKPLFAGGSELPRSSEDTSQLTSIICRNVPPDMKKDTLIQHFSQFGAVVKISRSRKNSHAIIRFYDHASAERAKRKGAKISPHLDPVPILWVQSVSKDKTPKKVQRNEVEDELQAMMEGQEDHPIIPPPKSLLPSKKASMLKFFKPKKPILPKREKPRNSNNLSDTSDILNLSKMLEQKTTNAEERYRVLDARDKLLRQNLKKQSDLNTAKSLYGTCTDTCPEKERYSRFAKKCLSSFEQKGFDNELSTNFLDHILIIKEYSRSSADQEEPLPHELRPVAALQLTMNYLLCNIIDRGKSGHTLTGEWYDFIWNRTRAIRKDITQQHLCCLATVEIVEKCARFHIHCAATLCEEEIAVFDPKINNENLTKCLQTLKHMYHDLSEENIKCPNEPEFRAYDILLSLKEGDTLRHVQKLRVDVRNHPDVQFAVKVAHAFSSNNFVRFFSLMESTTYLNACTLHRYFYEVRLQAIQITLRAFCAINRKELYPVQILCDTLKFEGLPETLVFVTMLGLKIENQDIVLDRAAFTLPETPFAVNRSSIVENKRTDCLGSAINRGPLPENPLHTYNPHNSFDDQGYLKNGAYDALDQCQNEDMEKQVLTPPLTTSVDVLPSQSVFQSVPAVPTLPEQYFPFSFVPTTPFGGICFTGPSVAEIKQMGKEDVDEAFRTAEELIQMEKREEMLKQGAVQVYKTISEPVVNFELRNIFGVVYGEEIEKNRRLEEMHRNALIKKKQRKLDEKTLVEQLLNNVIRNDLTDFIREESMALRKTMERKSMYCKNKVQLLIKTGVDDEIAIMVREIYDEEVNKWMSRLKEAKHHLEMQRAKKALLIWRKNASAKRTLETCKNLFPSGPPDHRSKQEKLSAQINPIWIMQSNQQLSRMLDAGVYCKTIRENISWHPLNLGPFFEKSIELGVSFPKLAPMTYYWKLLLVYDDDLNDPDYALFTEWLQAKFTKVHRYPDTSNDSGICSLHWLINSAGARIAICIRRISIGPQYEKMLHEMQEKSLLEGTNAVLFCLQKANIAESKTVMRLQDAIGKILRPSWKIPVHFLVANNGETLPSYVNFFMAQFRDKHYPSHEYNTTVFNLIQDFYDATKKLEDAVEWLLMHSPIYPELVMEYPKDFVNNSITSIFSIIYKDLAYRKSKNLTQDPRSLISFFNDAMENYASLLNSEALLKLSWPMPELSHLCEIDDSSYLWTSKKSKSEALLWIRDLLLPAFSTNPVDENSALQYGHKMDTLFNSGFPNMKSRISDLLKTIEDADLVEQLEVPWADIIYECAMFAVSALNLNVENDAKKTIVYAQEEMNNIDSTEVWHQTQLKFSPVKKRKCLFDERRNSKMRKTEEIVEQKFEKVESTRPKEQESMIKLEASKSKSPSQLQQNFALEIQQSDAFLLKLQKSVDFSSGVFMPAESKYEDKEVENYDRSQNLDISQKMELLKEGLQMESKATELLEKRIGIMSFI